MSRKHDTTASVIAPLQQFVALKNDIDVRLKAFADLSADHFNISPDEVDWTHVNGLRVLRNHLEEALSFWGVKP